MTDPQDTPAPPSSATHGTLTPDPQTPQGPPRPPGDRVRTPSLRVSAGLAALMLGIGIAVGATIGPAPSSSLAGTSDLPLLLRVLSTLEASRQATTAPAPTPAAPPPTPAPAPASSATATSSAPTPTNAQVAPSAPASSPAPSSTTPTATAPKTQAKPKPAALPAVTSVWLIELSGEGFAAAQADAAAAPYLTAQAIPNGALLSSWSTLDAGAFASETALLAGSAPQTLQTIVQPPCTEGTGGAACAPGTPGALSAADEFAKQTAATITATAAYRAHGLIVVTFSSIASAAAAGLPAGASSATLSSQPPAGVLLLSPFASPGTHPTTSFNPTSPRQSVEKLLHQ